MIDYIKWADKYREEAERCLNCSRLYTDRANRSKAGEALKYHNTARAYRRLAENLYMTAKELRRRADESAVQEEKMKRLTTDNPKGNFETMMNFAYAKDGNVILRYGAGKCDIDLCEYMESVANCRYTGLEAGDYMEGACLECDSNCPFGILYAVAVQAAELRGRLKEYEDCEEKAANDNQDPDLSRRIQSNIGG